MPRKSAKDREEELRIWESTPVYLTQKGLDELRAKLERLKKNLPEIIKEVARTAAYGDRSENAEYKAAKGRLRATQYQIANIEDELRKIKVIPSGPSSSGRVQMGSVVLLENKGKEVTFHIVGPKEANPSEGRISHVSPLGAALIDHAQGEIISFVSGGGTQEYKILKIS